MFARDHHRLASGRMNGDRHAGPLHEQAGYIIDGSAVDQRLQKIRTRSQERQDGDEEKPVLTGAGELNQYA